MRLQAVGKTLAYLRGTGERKRAREKLEAVKRQLFLVGCFPLYVYGHLAFKAKVFGLVIAGCLCAWLNHHQNATVVDQSPVPTRD